MEQVVKIKVLENYNILIAFKDGVEKVINFKKYLDKGFKKDLLDYSEFEKVYIEDGGGIAWENGYDFCPNLLKQI